MDRREIIKLGLGVTAGVTLGETLTGCATAPKLALPASHSKDMDGYLSNLDQQLHKIRQGHFLEGFVSQATGTTVTPELREKIEVSEKQFQNIMHTLMLTQSFRDLSEEEQLHPEMQKRMAENIDSIDATVFEVNDMLANLDEQQREATQATLKKHPGLAMHLAEALDEQADMAGVSRKRRAQLRSILTQASFRLTHNDPSLVIDEYVKKVRRSMEPSRAEIAASQFAAQYASEPLFRSRGKFDTLGGVSEDKSIEASADSTAVPGEHGAKVGAKMMGIGVLTFGVSAIFVSSLASPFLVGMTVGAVLFAIGLITLIISGIIYAVNKK